jgi:hypothetical protein
MFKSGSGQYESSIVKVLWSGEDDDEVVEEVEVDCIEDEVIVESKLELEVEMLEAIVEVTEVVGTVWEREEVWEEKVVVVELWEVAYRIPPTAAITITTTIISAEAILEIANPFFGRYKLFSLRRIFII